MHLGGLRTALYNYLLARATGGKFVLRIEDTDQSRLVSDAEQRLYDDLRWAGLTWDEGPDVEGPYGPYKQSQRLAHYDNHVNRLLQAGKAYRCFCTPQDLDLQKRAAIAVGKSSHYPGTCLGMSAEESEERAAHGETYAVRFLSIKPPEPTRMIQDLVFRQYQKKEYEEDFIIRKRDGFPTYHFANVIDDKAMEITHVLRGTEWLISTPKHVELYDALGWTPPMFAHVGLLVNEERQKLSKRHEGAGMDWYKEHHILPGALLNFAALLGWSSPPSTSDTRAPSKGKLTLEDMVSQFTLKFTKGDIIVNMQKLDHIQKWHTKQLLEREPPDWPNLERYICEPTEKAIRKHGTQLHRHVKLDSELVTPLQHLSNSEEGNVAVRKEGHKYILQAIRAISTVDLTKLDAYVLDEGHWGLFWKPCKESLAVSASPFLDSLRSADSAKLLFADNHPVTAGEALGRLRDVIRAVPEADWKEKRLRGAVQTASELVMIKPARPLAYHFFRWALLCAKKSPGISGVMEVLGREETLRRLALALQVAERPFAMAPPDLDAGYAPGTHAVSR